MAAIGSNALGAVVFVGGSDNPYNYNGIGYNGEPSQPVADMLLLDVESGDWRVLTVDGPPTMDHRALAPLGDKLVSAGGMLADQQTTDRVTGFSIRR